MRRSELKRLSATALAVVLSGWPLANALAAEGKESIAEKQRQGEKGGRPADEANPTEIIAPLSSEERRVEDTNARPWALTLEIEGHHLIRQTDVDQATANFMYYAITGRYHITKYDRVQASIGAYQLGIKDPGETGFRASDLALSYQRLIPLPEEFNLRLRAQLLFPTSFLSSNRSLIMEPSIRARVTKVFGPAVVGAAVRYRYEWMKYTTAAGGAVNPRSGLTFGADVEVAMPFWKSLSVGADLFTTYRWYYEVGNLGPDGSTSFGTVRDSQFDKQPMTQSYGGNVFVRYAFPPFEGIETDLRVAYGNGSGDSVLHDGVARFYAFYRRSSEVFAAFTAAY